MDISQSCVEKNYPVSKIIENNGISYSIFSERSLSSCHLSGSMVVTVIRQVASCHINYLRRDRTFRNFNINVNRSCTQYG